jgi:Golgi nucleoside diphosphatase
MAGGALRVLAVSLLVVGATSLPASLLRYALVFDAGSSGTRLHVFKWAPTQSADEIPRLVLPQPTKKVKPGLSSFAESPQTAGASLAPLFVFAEEHVPTEFWKDTPVLLRATAGLRLLPVEKAEEILQSCRSFIASTRFKYSPENVFLMGGAQEGAYGWLAVNYLHQRLSPDKPSLGVFELGGASMQVTFALSDTSDTDEVRRPHVQPPTMLCDRCNVGLSRCLR